MANVYDIGDVVRCANNIQQSGVDTDPSALTATVRTPSGTSTTYTYGTDVALVKDSAGDYHIDVTVTEAGRWRVRWVSTGTGAAAEEQYFMVRPRAF